ncbi:MAG: hypothetical protein HGA85_00260 [Nanoarchaeota archaeon]|nr:hypothetical protein [Nanoarchaeota archaeon]
MIQQFYNQYFQRNNLRVVLALGLTFFIASTLIDIRPLLYFALFCILNAGFLTYERYVDLQLDLEFSTFATVLMTLKYGLAWGLIAGVGTKIAAVLYNKDFNMNTIYSLAAYIAAAFFAGLFAMLHYQNLVLTGILVSVLVNLFSFFLMKFSDMASPYQLVMYGVSNIMFNIIVFLGFSQIVFKIMI